MVILEILIEYVKNVNKKTVRIVLVQIKNNALNVWMGIFLF